MEDLVVRPLREGDFDRGFLEALSNLRDPELTPDEARMVFEEDIGRYPRIYAVFVAELAGRVVGTITLLIERKFIHGGGRVGHVEDVAAHVDYQRRGIGAALVRRALHEAFKQRGCYKALLDCGDHNVAFYEKLGFRRVENCMRCDREQWLAAA